MVISEVAVVTAKVSTDLNNENMEEHEGVGGPKDGSHFRIDAAASTGVASENGGSANLVRVSVIKTMVNNSMTSPNMVPIIKALLC